MLDDTQHAVASGPRMLVDFVARSCFHVAPIRMHQWIEQLMVECMLVYAGLGPEGLLSSAAECSFVLILS